MKKEWRYKLWTLKYCGDEEDEMIETITCTVDYRRVLGEKKWPDYKRERFLSSHQQKLVMI